MKFVEDTIPLLRPKVKLLILHVTQMKVAHPTNLISSRAATSVGNGPPRASRLLVIRTASVDHLPVALRSWGQRAVSLFGEFMTRTLGFSVFPDVPTSPCSLTFAGLRRDPRPFPGRQSSRAGRQWRARHQKDVPSSVRP